MALDDDDEAMANEFFKYVADLAEEAGLDAQQVAILVLQHVAAGGFQNCDFEEAKAEARELFFKSRRH